MKTIKVIKIKTVDGVTTEEVAVGKMGVTPFQFGFLEAKVKWMNKKIQKTLKDYPPKQATQIKWELKVFPEQNHEISNNSKDG